MKSPNHNAAPHLNLGTDGQQCWSCLLHANRVHSYDLEIREVFGCRAPSLSMPFWEMLSGSVNREVISLVVLVLHLGLRMGLTVILGRTVLLYCAWMLV